MKYEDIISFEALYRANKIARKGKMYKKEVIDFQNNLGSNLWKLHYELKYNTYKLGKYYKFIIYDPKEREIQAIPYIDRVVLHSLCDNYLVPTISKQLIYDNVACLKKKGSSLACKRLRMFMSKHYKKYSDSGYFIKVDISKYFDSIDHELLKVKISKYIHDERILNMVYYIIDSYEKSPCKGLPMGNQTSKAFALLYLNDLDHFIKEKLKIKYYLRYMDDMIMIVENKKIARDYIKKIFCFINNERLMINPKSCIIPIKNGIEFLGYRYYYEDNGKIVQKIKQQTRRRIIYKIKNKIYMNEDISKSLISYKGFCDKCNSYFFYKKILSYKK